MGRPTFPTHVQIQTTSACGAACCICPHPAEAARWPNGLMSDDLFDHIVEQLRGRKIDYLCPYLMADPLSDRRIFERTARLREVLPDTHIELSTTGLYLRPRMIERLLAAPLSELRISSHGITVEDYATTMPGVDFEKAMPNIERFVERWQARPPYPLSVVCLWGLWSPEREAQIEAFWKRKGVEVCKWRVVSRARQVDLTVLGEVSRDPTPYHHGRRHPPYMCRFHRDTRWLHILSDGRVTLCCMDYGQEVILGDAREQSLEEIANNDAFRQVRAQVRGDAASDPSFLCSRCEWHVSRSTHEREREPNVAEPDRVSVRA